jgi:hypothetical protein
MESGLDSEDCLPVTPLNRQMHLVYFRLKCPAESLMFTGHCQPQCYLLDALADHDNLAKIL